MASWGELRRQQAHPFPLRKHIRNDSLYNGSHAEEILKHIAPTHNANLPKTNAAPLQTTLRRTNTNMQHEIESFMNHIDSRDVVIDSDSKAAALVDRAKKATLWRVDEPRASRIQGEFARREIRVMKSYRPKLLRESVAAARIRSEMLDELNTGLEGEGEGEVFWEGCRTGRQSNQKGEAPDEVGVETEVVRYSE